MSATQSSKADKIDERTELLIFGYMRLMESELELSIIPPLVIHLCILFYRIQECFDRAPDTFEISDNNLRVKNVSNSGWKHTVYCQYPIPSMSNLIYEWTFKFQIHGQERTYTSNGFGLASNDNCVDMDFCQNVSPYIPNYGMYDGTGGDAQKNRLRIGSAGLIFADGDVIKIILNLKKQTLGHQVNDMNVNIVFNDIEKSDNITYQMVLQMTEQASFTIKDFLVSS